MSTEGMLAEDETDALMVTLARYGIKCQYYFGLIHHDARAGYIGGVIYRDFDTTLESFIHEVGHAIDDLNGSLDVEDRRTGELVACLFSELFFRKRLITSLFFGYLSYLRQLAFNPKVRAGKYGNFVSGVRRAFAAMKHPLARDLKRIVDED